MTESSPGVATIAQQVARGEITATEVAEDHLRRAEISQARLNTFTLIDEAGALAAAAAVDQRIRAGEEVGPLAGVPIAIKDLIDQAGLPNTAGSSFPAPTPAASATVVQRLEDAGAVLIGRTGLHEYAFGFSSENHWFGPVRNPWDATLSPGGSSGGSGAAVAAGVAAAALGTDTGGSVRVPAALCGVVGLKVTHGRVPLTGVFPLAPSLDTVGPIARSVPDARLVYSVIAGHDPTDPWSAPRPVPTSGNAVDLSTATIAVPHPWVDLPKTEEVADAFAEVVRRLKAAGVKVIAVDSPDLVPAKQLEYSVYPEVAIVHRKRWHEYPKTYGPDVSQRLGEVFTVDPIEYVRAQEWRARTRHAAEAALNQADFLLTPAVAAAAKPIGDEHIKVDGKLVSYRPQLSRYSALVNHIGLPAIVLPLDRQGTPPPSIQIIGRAWDESGLLGLGAALERVGLTRYRTPPEAVI
jgi:aspartyl-tRNA(Asn)/glutamyl-tRNA(Gln) amidotransferase subunit A